MRFPELALLDVAGALDEAIERLALHKLHRVEVVWPLLPRCNNEATLECRSLAAVRFAQKT